MQIAAPGELPVASSHVSGCGFEMKQFLGEVWILLQRGAQHPLQSTDLLLQLSSKHHLVNTGYFNKLALPKATGICFENCRGNDVLALAHDIETVGWKYKMFWASFLCQQQGVSWASAITARENASFWDWSGNLAWWGLRFPPPPLICFLEFSASRAEKGHFAVNGLQDSRTILNSYSQFFFFFLSPGFVDPKSWICACLQKEEVAIPLTTWRVRKCYLNEFPFVDAVLHLCSVVRLFLLIHGESASVGFHR